VSDRGVQTTCNESRQGIALIITLGMLSVMMILGVAFVIAMRTERVAAGNFMEVMKARHLVYTALARAMDDVESDLDAARKWRTTGGPPWRETTSTAYPTQWRTNYYPFVVEVDLYTGDAQKLLPSGLFHLLGKLPSPGHIDKVEGSFGSPMTVTDKKAAWNVGVLNYLPGYDWMERVVPGGARRKFWEIKDNAADTITATSMNDTNGWDVGDLYRIVQPQWQEVGDAGKIAYLVVDLSGLLDAEYAGQNPQNREMGSDPAEILLDRLSDIDSIPNLLSHRSVAAPYERISDFTNANVSTVSQVRGLDRLRPTGNFFTYSRFPAAFTNVPPAMVSVDENELVTSARQGPIRSSLREIVRQYYPTPGLLQDAAVDALFVNLHDYIDQDSIPGSFLNSSGVTDGPYVEAVPMISEIAITNSFTANATNIIAGKSWVSVEYAYPFAAPPDHAPFTMQYTVDYVPGANCPSNLFATASISNTKGPFSPSPANPYAKVGGSILQPIGINSVPNPTNFTFSVRVTASMLDSTGATVDRIPPITLPVTVVNLTETTPFANEVGSDVIDPVYNWDAVHWQSTASYPWIQSMGSINNATTNFFGKSGALIDTNLAMHVQNGAMKSVGELGYLYFPGGAFGNTTLYNIIYSTVGMKMTLSPWLWRTIRLYDRGDGTRWDPVLDYFTVSDDSVRRGLVNLNSQDREPLRAVFYGMKKDDYPGDPAGSDVNWLEAGDVSDSIQACTYTNQCLKLSDIGRSNIVNRVLASGALNLAGASEVRKESFIRNSCGLLHTRQNLYAILLAGKSKIAVEQRALAIVWRDPLAENGQHRSFIRWFTWLEK